LASQIYLKKPTDLTLVDAKPYVALAASTEDHHVNRKRSPSDLEEPEMLVLEAVVAVVVVEAVEAVVVEASESTHHGKCAGSLHHGKCGKSL
jgi:L-aminopeptidase/D-esterase-like protein